MVEEVTAANGGDADSDLRAAFGALLEALTEALRQDPGGEEPDSDPWPAAPWMRNEHMPRLQSSVVPRAVWSTQHHTQHRV